MERHLTDDPWIDINTLEVPSHAGRRLDAGGFVLGDPFDTVLRHLSADYLYAAWRRLQPVLHHYGIEPDDLSWGWLHGGETRISGLEQPAPSNFTGWTTLQVDHFRFDEDPRFTQIDGELKVGSPALRCGSGWRSQKWTIGPDDIPLALRLIEALWTDEPSDWSPHAILWDQQRITAKASKGMKVRELYTSPEDRLHDETQLAEPWRKVAASIEKGNQDLLESELAEAHAAYSPFGYNILLRGFKKYLSQAGGTVSIHLP